MEVEGLRFRFVKMVSILWQQVLANGNTAGINYNVTTTVATAGQAIDFHINRGADGNEQRRDRL